MNFAYYRAREEADNFRRQIREELLPECDQLRQRLVQLTEERDELQEQVEHLQAELARAGRGSTVADRLLSSNKKLHTDKPSRKAKAKRAK